MKTLNLIILIIITIGIECFSQNELVKPEHLMFKGVPINGTLNEYVSEMKKSGFYHIGTENQSAILEGDFAGYKGCYIGVATIAQKDLVSKITVIFPEKETWSTLSSNYFNLKELLTEKYGKPARSVEKWDTYSKPRDDGDRIHNVAMNRCKYYTTFELKNGSIQISIENDGFSSSYVILSYYDKINSEKIRQGAKGDL